MYQHKIAFDNPETLDSWIHHNCQWLEPGRSATYGINEAPPTRAHLAATLKGYPNADHWSAVYESEQPFGEKEVADIRLFMNIGGGHGMVNIDFNNSSRLMSILPS